LASRQSTNNTLLVWHIRPSAQAPLVEPRARPRVVPAPRAILDVPLVLEYMDEDAAVLVVDASAIPAPLPPLVMPPLVRYVLRVVLTPVIAPPLTRVPRVPLVEGVLPKPLPLAAAPLRSRDASSARRLVSARLRSSSAARRSACAALTACSASASAMSALAPFHVGFRMSRWLCSVWLRIRVQVLSSVLAVLTVFATVFMLPFARSSVPTTPSINSLMLRTPSNSLRSIASRASLWS